MKLPQTKEFDQFKSYCIPIKDTSSNINSLYELMKAELNLISNSQLEYEAGIKWICDLIEY